MSFYPSHFYHKVIHGSKPTVRLNLNTELVSDEESRLPTRCCLPIQQANNPGQIT